MFQQTIIVGNVGRDPELRFTPGGSAVCDFSVAVNRTWTGADGQQQEKVTWFKVTCWNKLAEVVNQYVTKGRQVLVTGDVDASAWTDKEGNARATLELNARDVKFLGSRDDAQAAPADKGGGSGRSLADIPFDHGYSAAML